MTVKKKSLRLIIFKANREVKLALAIMRSVKLVSVQSAKVSAEMAKIAKARLATNLKGTAAITVAAEVTSVATAWVRAAP